MQSCSNKLNGKNVPRYKLHDSCLQRIEDTIKALMSGLTINEDTLESKQPLL